MSTEKTNTENMKEDMNKILSMLDYILKKIDGIDADIGRLVAHNVLSEEKD